MFQRGRLYHQPVSSWWSSYSYYSYYHYNDDYPHKNYSNYYNPYNHPDTIGIIMIIL